MPASYVTGYTASISATANAKTITTDTDLADGDILVGACFGFNVASGFSWADNSGSITPTFLGSVEETGSGSNYIGHRLWWARASSPGASETISIDYDGTGTPQFGMSCVVIRGAVASGSPVTVLGADNPVASSQTATGAAVTPSASGLLVAFFLGRQASGTWTTATGMTARINLVDSAVGAAMQTQPNMSASVSTGTRASTNAASTSLRNAQMLVIEEAASGGGGSFSGSAVGGLIL